MNIHHLWNKCVDETNDVVGCLELYTGKIKETIFDDIDKIKLNYQGSHKMIDEEEYQRLKEKHISLKGKVHANGGEINGEI